MKTAAHSEAEVLRASTRPAHRDRSPGGNCRQLEARRRAPGAGGAGGAGLQAREGIAEIWNRGPCGQPYNIF